MCIYTEKEKPFVAKQDITCYKILRVGSNRIRDLYTPFIHHPVTVGEAVNALYPDEPLYFDDDVYAFCVTWQGVHAYQDEATAFKKAVAGMIPCVARCTIPAGTEYWKGRNSDIAAKELRIEKILVV